MRKSPSTKKTPTPTATEKIRTLFGKAGTCAASTVRSGSAMVTTAPIRRAAMTRKGRLRFSDSRAPTSSPIGVMAISEPRVKSVMPTMSIAALRANKSTVGPFRGAMVKASASTIRAIGATEKTASLNFVPTALSNGSTSQHIKYLYAIITFPRGLCQRRAGKV